MNTSSDRISSFVAAVRARLNRVWLARVCSGTLFAVALGLLLWCGFWVLRGYAVPRLGYLTAAVVVPSITLVAWLLGRYSPRQSALFADHHFGLKDALVSHLGFREKNRDGEFVVLQQEVTAERVAQLSPKTIPMQWPRRLLGAAAVLLLSCFLMAFKTPSAAVLEKLAIEQETTRKTEEINEEIERQVEEMLKSASDEEQELLQPDEWRRWVKELRETKDQKAAMRQYAELEQRLAEAAQKLGQRDQEHLLAKAAQELGQEAALKPLAKSLEEKDYRKAADQLRQMELKADVQKPDEAQKELARLKSSAQRMAAAARSYQQRSGQQGSEGKGQQSQSQAQSGQQGEKGQKGQQGQSGQQGGQSQQGQQQSMDQQMAALEQSVQQFQQSLQQKQSQSQCQSRQSQANQALQKLCQSMCQCAGKRDAAKKLASLCQCMSQCQGFLCDKQGQSLSQCMGQKSGKGIGAGSVESRRHESELAQDNGRRDQLQGQKGAGPSDTTTESADSGTGTATRAAQLKDRPWQRQMESFIQREDVPPEVKDGVREYFKGIQQVGEEKK
jgi:hypothetical protein